MTTEHERKRKANTFSFKRGKKRKRETKQSFDDRQRAIDEWLQSHEVTRLPAGFSQYGWQR